MVVSCKQLQFYVLRIVVLMDLWVGAALAGSRMWIQWAYPLGVSAGVDKEGSVCVLM